MAYQYPQTGAQVAANLAKAATATQPGDAVSTLAETATAKILTSAERAKLAAIEDSATADQTAQEIATAIDADTTAENTLKSALGLGTAAYTASTAYATSSQGDAADSALQPADIATGTITPKIGDLDLNAIGGGGVTDHGALTGLSDDDHTQYHTDARGDARYDAIGAAASAVSTHELAYDHAGIATAIQPGDLAAVATSGSYSDLTGTPTLGTAAATDSFSYATAAQGSKADTALQPLAIGVSVQGYDADTSKTDIDETFTGKKTLSGGYNERGGTLTQSGGALVIPIDGGTYVFTPTALVDTPSFNKPTAPICSSSTVIVKQGETGYAVALPAGVTWTSATTTISSDANAIVVCVFWTDPDGDVYGSIAVGEVV